MVERRKASENEGPPLREYVETRFNLLVEDITDKLSAQNVALQGFVDNMKQALSATDLRYQERFEGQTKALDAAFLSQQTAMQAALAAAKEAVQAALAAADRAVSKTEQSADKRFDSLAQLINQRFDTIVARIDSTDSRMGKLEGRMNTSSGEAVGGQRVQTDNKSLWAIVIAAAAVVYEIASAYLRNK